MALSAPVGTGLDNDEDDVKAMAENLSWRGYPEADSAAETGQWDDSVEGGLRQYQRERGLTVDGWAGPGGETERALNGDVSRGSGEGAPDTVASAGTVARFLDRLPAAGLGRAQPGNSLLEIDAPPRANPFAAARAHFAREDAASSNAAPVARPDAVEPLFARNTVTGQPLRLKALSSRRDDIDQAAPPTLDDVERVLTKRGYRYRPDPMGRIGEGDWLDAGGNVLDPAEKQRIGADSLPGDEHRLSDSIATAEDFDRFVQRLPLAPATDDDARDDEEIIPAQDDGGGRSWGKFGAALAKGGKIIGGPNPIPADLARRIGYIRDPTMRTTVERIVSGGVPDKGGKFGYKDDYNVFKLGGRYGASMDFWYAVNRMGGTRKDIVVKPGGEVIFAARDGTTITYRRTVSDRVVTNEIQIRGIDRSSGFDYKLKIRYEDALFPK